jgi:hypothetical protein
MSMSDFASSLPRPTPLSRAVLIWYQWGEQKFEIICTACSVRTFVWKDTGEPVTWLHCTAMRTAEVNRDGPTRMMNVLIPAHYVTDIKPGPPFQLGRRDSQGSGDVGVFPPIHPPPDGALPLEEIEQTIVRFLDPVLN